MKEVKEDTNVKKVIEQLKERENRGNEKYGVNTDRTDLSTIEISLEPEDEGRMLFFPAWLSHQVFPFYGTDKERITISGNIIYNNIEKNNETEKNSERS